MLIKIDYREKSLYDLCINHKNTDNFKNIIVEQHNLPLGDIIINDDDNNELLIIERKTLTDLASSIRDGRYKEQSFRLSECSMHNHNIIYIIEGALSTYNRSNYKNSISESTLLSCIISLNYYKGFSTYRTLNTIETAMYLLYLASKLQREKDKKQPYYSKLIIELPKIITSDSSGNLSTNLSIQENNDEEKYCEVLSKRVKKNNITTKNIGEIILSQIPNVSNQSAIAIMVKFKTIKALLYSLEENRNCMNDIRVGKIGKERRLSKICISNIFKFLVETDD